MWKFTPSAVWSRIRLLRMVKLFIGPSIQAPTLVCCIQTLSMTESLIAPPIALTWSSSTRSRMSPMMAKSLTRDVAGSGRPGWPYLP